MWQEIDITDEDIQYSEKILLPAGMIFDDERKNFICNLTTLDLQAVPGSGKTTVLLAKLLILEKKLPFQDGSGILVLSHTNTAIDEIKNKIQKHCPKLFSYPNFIGTIQSFVDEFLAMPYYASKYKKKITRIDNEIYQETVDKYLTINLKDFKFQEQKNARYFLIGNDLKYKFRFQFNDGKLKIVDSINGNDLKITKPKKGKNWEDFTVDEKSKINEWLIKFKSAILYREGVLHFDDAYFLADVYLSKYPNIINILQKRFSAVFVDEMQDMDTHQYNVLEKIFFDEGNSLSIFQRIGDKNQAIYNSVKVSEIWNDRKEILRLNGSQRLSRGIAEIVGNFALCSENGFKIIGLNQCGIKPHILVFENSSIKDVIPHFGTMINNFRNKALLIDFDRYPCKIVAWNTEWKSEGDRDNISKLRLVDYYANFKKDKQKPRQDYSSLKSYLLFYDRNKQTLESIRKNVLNAFLKILRIEQITDLHSRNYTKKKLLDFIKQNDPSFYENFNLNLYNWCIGIIRGETNEMCLSIRKFIPVFFGFFSNLPLSASLIFIDGEEEDMINEKGEIQDCTNFYRSNGLEIEITSVHAVKGQTHCATLYVESFFDKGYGNYESERLRNQFLGTQSIAETLLTIKNSHEKIIQSAKMAYVGFSRPTNFLCVAIHKDRYDSNLSEIDKKIWEVVKI